MKTRMADGSRELRSFRTMALAASVLVLGACAAPSSTGSSGRQSTASSGRPSTASPSQRPASPSQQPTATSSRGYDWAAQELVDRYAALVVRDKRAPAKGYCDVSIGAATKTLTVWWHGPVPARVRDVFARAERGDVHVALRPARYDQRMLQPYLRRVVDSLMGAHGPVTEASARVDCDGLEVGVARITAARRAQIRAVVGPSIPVRVVRAQPLPA